MEKPRLVDGTIFFYTGQFLLYGAVGQQNVSVIEKELENSGNLVVRYCEGSMCTIYETDRYTIIHDFQKSSSICFHAANLHKIDLICKYVR
jgi:hypothetical protein